MSLRTQHDLAELRRERASATGAGARLAAVLHAGLQHLGLASAPTPINAGAPRGGRLPHEEPAFDRDRRWRLTASMLPYWLGLEGASRSAVKRSEIVRILGEYGGMYRGTYNDFAQGLMRYGRENEIHGIVGYMEMTRSLVGLGTTRVRENRANGEFEEEYDDARRDGSTAVRSWELHEQLSATPDGFVIDALQSGLGRGLGPKGLLEVKCPAAIQLVEGVRRRHHPDIRIKPEENTYLLLQAFQQLLVCTEAQHIDLVHWKRAQNGDDYVWIARLYAQQDHMSAIRDAIKGSVEQFVRAIRATRGVDDDSATEFEDEANEYLRQDTQARAHAAKLKADEGDKEKKRERKVEKANVRAKLSAWTDECLRWRNGYEPESELGAFPWRSYKYLREKNLPTTGLCHRFHVHTGRAANHDGPGRTVATGQSASVDLGYAEITAPAVGGPRPGHAVEARDIWGQEPIGMH